MTSWLVSLTSDRAVRVRALAGEILMCSSVGKTLNTPIVRNCASLHPVARVLENLMLGGGITL